MAKLFYVFSEVPDTPFACEVRYEIEIETGENKCCDMRQ